MRKGKAPVRHIEPDQKYNDVSVAKFINCLMKEGKKELARKIFYQSLDIVAQKSEQTGIEIWRQALDNVMPTVEAVRRRARGTIRQVPMEVRPKRKVFLGIKWLIGSACARSGKSMQERLAYEILAAAAGEGNAVKKRTTIHKMAESNKAFSHIRI